MQTHTHTFTQWRKSRKETKLIKKNNWEREDFIYLFKSEKKKGGIRWEICEQMKVECERMWK